MEQLTEKSGQDVAAALVKHQFDVNRQERNSTLTIGETGWIICISAGIPVICSPQSSLASFGRSISGNDVSRRSL